MPEPGGAMPRYVIFYDSFQEGMWFKALHPDLAGSVLKPFTEVPDGIKHTVLAYDRPDIVLADGDEPILVVERTVEVPSGHNVGQRFARLAAAAQHRIPTVYFGPYSAYKHGGATQGPRYMNLRLFMAIDDMNTIEDASVVTIRWPIDKDFEIIQTPEKDDRMREYLILFFRLYKSHGVPGMTSVLADQAFVAEQDAEEAHFIAREVANPDQYKVPPNSVEIGPPSAMACLKGVAHNLDPRVDVLVYNVGMRQIRSDPYTGMAILYAYLYSGGMRKEERKVKLVLWFPHISLETWRAASARTPHAKQIRLYRDVADGIVFVDKYVPSPDF